MALLSGFGLICQVSSPPASSEPALVSTLTTCRTLIPSLHFHLPLQSL
jgi:hypothetical protein